MNWISRLCDVYDHVSGTPAVPSDGGPAPAGFTHMHIDYNIIISKEGEFVTAQHLAEADKHVVPCTPQAETRTSSKIVPYPLADKLKYLIVKDESDNRRYEAYLSRLTDWSQTPDAPECLKVLVTYLRKRTLYADMMSAGVLKNKDNEKSIACFSVQCIDKENRLWMREDVFDSWLKRWHALNDECPVGLCYATGERLPLMESHPRIKGNAKLISAKDDDFPFRYCGRFTEKGSAAQVSIIASSKAHNTLKWLLERQGFRRFGMYFVGWNIDEPVMAVDDGDALTELGAADYDAAYEAELDDAFCTEAKQPTRLSDTLEAYVNALFRSISGRTGDYKRASDPDDQTDEMKRRVSRIVLMGMQAATDGRMSITYYQEMPGNMLVERIENWHRECRWLTVDKGRGVDTVTWREICEAVMGASAVKKALEHPNEENSATKQMRGMQLRLLHCVVNGAALPESMVSAAYHRALQPSSFTDAEGKWQKWDWLRCVSTACALIRKRRLDAKESPELDYRMNPNCTDRDYLYGRLLAVAFRIETEAHMLPGEKTNSLRLLANFVQRPAQTWQKLFLKLIPALEKLDRRADESAEANRPDARHYLSLLGEIESLFRERESARPLSERFLLGFSAQSRSLRLHGNALAYRPPAARDELYGCLLAVADCCEAEARRRKDSRQTGLTNALHLMNAYVASPSRTWKTVHDKLIPYLESIGVKSAAATQRLICRLERRFTEDERLSSQPLGDGFLHGYLRMHLALRSAALDAGAWQTDPCDRPRPQTREALFGALLALENDTERAFLDSCKSEEENRSSNAMRYLTRAAQRPSEVWAYLEKRMEPYARGQWLADRLREQADALRRQLEQQGFDTDSPLKPEYLHYFYLYSNIC